VTRRAADDAADCRVVALCHTDAARRVVSASVRCRAALSHTAPRRAVVSGHRTCRAFALPCRCGTVSTRGTHKSPSQPRGGDGCSINVRPSGTWCRLEMSALSEPPLFDTTATKVEVELIARHPRVSHVSCTSRACKKSHRN
jgi:hypothetical protein